MEGPRNLMTKVSLDKYEESLGLEDTVVYVPHVGMGN